MIFIAFLINFSFFLSNLIMLQNIFNPLKLRFHICVFKTDASKSEKKHCVIKDIRASIL